MDNNNSSNSMYGRSAGSSVARTIISGMKPRAEQTESAPVATDTRALDLTLQSRPLAGILFSVSRDACGEIFPVYIGRNTIGSDPQSDIYLTEDTVSADHAILLVRCIEDMYGGEIRTMSITDYDSDFGTAVDGVKLGFDKCELRGNEVIQIGNSYQLLFIPLDAKGLGLFPIPGFVATQRVSRPGAHKANPVADAPAKSSQKEEEDIYPTSVGAEHERTFYGRTMAKKPAIADISNPADNKTVLNG